MSAIEEFKKKASSASFHFADDSGKEWGLARKAESAALDIYRSNPDIQE